MQETDDAWLRTSGHVPHRVSIFLDLEPFKVLLLIISVLGALPISRQHGRGGCLLCRECRHADAPVCLRSASGFLSSGEYHFSVQLANDHSCSLIFHIFCHSWCHLLLVSVFYLRPPVSIIRQHPRIIAGRRIAFPIMVTNRLIRVSKDRLLKYDMLLPCS